MGDDNQKLWGTRRRLTYLALIWLAGNVDFILYRGTDSALNQQVSLACLGAFTMILGSFLGFSTWHDIGKPDRCDPCDPAPGDSK